MGFSPEAAAGQIATTTIEEEEALQGRTTSQKLFFKETSYGDGRPKNRKIRPAFAGHIFCSSGVRR